MATSCPIGFDAKRLREQVTRTYERVAADPAGGFHFDVGPRYAIEVLGYPRKDIESLPASCGARFAAVCIRPPEEYCGIAQTSKNVLAGLAPRVQWLEAFVAHDKVYCAFLAESAEAIEEHARRTGFPANRIERVHGMIDPTCASA